MKRIILSLISIICIISTAGAQDIVNLRQDAKSLGLRYQVAYVDEDVLVRKEYFREDWPQRKWFRDDLRNCLREESGNIYNFDRNGLMTKHTYTLRGTNIRSTSCTYVNGQLNTLLGEGCKIVRHGNDLDIYSESSTYASQALDNRKDDYAFDLKCRMEWADDGQLLASRYYYVDSTLAKTFEYSYNHRGQIASVVSKDYGVDPKHPSKVVTRYTYDNNDFLQKMTVRGESFDDTYTYENNEHGDPVKMTYTTSYSTTIYEYEYKYDNSGNWTMRLQFKDGVFENATLRSIIYHSNGDAVSQQMAATLAAQKEAQQQAKANEAAMKQGQKVEKKSAKATKDDKAPAIEKKAKKETTDSKADKNTKDSKAKASKKENAKADKNAEKAKSSKAEKTKSVKDKDKKGKADKKAKKAKSVKGGSKDKDKAGATKKQAPKAKAEKGVKEQKAADKSKNTKKENADKKAKGKKNADKDTPDELR